MNVTPLGRPMPTPWHLYEQEKARIGLAECEPLDVDEWEAILGEYRPGQRPRIIRGRGTCKWFGVATLRCPSGETMLLTVWWRRHMMDEQPLLDTLGRVAEAIAETGRWLYVHWSEQAQIHSGLRVGPRSLS